MAKICNNNKTYVCTSSVKRLICKIKKKENNSNIASIILKNYKGEEK